MWSVGQIQPMEFIYQAHLTESGLLQNPGPWALGDMDISGRRVSEG